MKSSDLYGDATVVLWCCPRMSHAATLTLTQTERRCLATELTQFSNTKELHYCVSRVSRAPDRWRLRAQCGLKSVHLGSFASKGDAEAPFQSGTRSRGGQNLDFCLDLDGKVQALPIWFKRIPQVKD